MSTILAFQGSRILDSQKVIEIIKMEIEKHNPEYVITSGEASGVCEKTREYCKRNGIPLKLHFLQKKYARGIYHHRSIAVIKESSFCVFIHDGKSKGTQNEIEIAKKLNKPMSYHKVKDEGIEPLGSIDELKLEWDFTKISSEKLFKK